MRRSWTLLVLPFFLSLPMGKPSVADENRPDIHLQKIATITNDRNPSVSELSVTIDSENRVQAIHFLTNKHDGEPPTVSEVVFPLQEIESPQGVVLDGDATHRVFILQGSIQSDQGRGDLVVRFLSNGLFGTYDECQVKLDRSPDGQWSLINAYDGRKVTEIKAVTWALGITTVQNVCPEN